MSYMRRTAAASILFIALTACSLPARASAQEILWDAYGVPHIRGETLEEVSWAFGWARAKAVIWSCLLILPDLAKSPVRRLVLVWEAWWAAKESGAPVGRWRPNS